MAEDQDQFFIEPQIQQLRDIQPLPSPSQQPPHQAKMTKEQGEHINLKMVEIPKEQLYAQYSPFRLKHPYKQEESEQEEEIVHRGFSSLDFREKNNCVYQRYNNEFCRKICNSQSFTGLLAHRKILLEVNCRETHELATSLQDYYSSSMPTNTKLLKNDLIFSSKFESGNLFAAYKISEFQYDLLMSNDTNSFSGSNQWFYFSVENMIPNKNYSFSIINFTKSDSLFNYGMAPTVYSMGQNKQMENLQHGWKRLGRQITYKKGTLLQQNKKRYYYRLNFTLSTSYQKDKLYISHSYPYTCEKLRLFLNDKINRFPEIVTRLIIGKTISKRPLQALMICQNINKKRDSRKAIIIMARQHPGQTQGSYVCEGVIDRLVQKTKQAQFLLKNYVFYVIPMVNPDGVVFGHYRTNLMGKDLNRRWNATQKDSNCPQIAAIKSFLQDISKQREIRFMIDLHGHSKKFNSFFYGNPYPENPEVAKIFPFTCSKLHSGIQYLDCTFTAQQDKKRAARVYLSTLHHIVHIYTFQSSFYAYFQDGKKVQFTPKQYRKLGAVLITSLHHQLQHEVKYQQTYQFNLKKINSKEALNSPFIKFLSQLRSTKELLNHGDNYESGSQSKPDDGELNNQDIEKYFQNGKKKSELQNSSIDLTSNTVKIKRRGVRDARDYNHNKPIRNIRFLQISKIHSVLPDKNQLALQPIRKRQSVPEQHMLVLMSNGQFRLQNYKSQGKFFDLKSSEIESCELSSVQKKNSATERRLSSLIQSMNNNRNNLTFKFQTNWQSVPRPNKVVQIHNRNIKNAHSHTMLGINNKQDGKVKSSQLLPAVQGTEKERYELLWPRISQISLNNSLRCDNLKQTESLYNGLMKKFMNDKESFLRAEEVSNKNERSNLYRRSEMSKK